MSRLPQSPHTLRQARARGIVQRSGVATAAAALVASLLVVETLGPAFATDAAAAARALWSRPDAPDVHEPMLALGGAALRFLVPALLLAWLATGFAGWAMTRFNIATAWWRQGPPGWSGLFGKFTILRRAARLGIGLLMAAVSALLLGAMTTHAASTSGMAWDETPQWTGPLHRLAIIVSAVILLATLFEVMLARAFYQRLLSRTPSQARREDHRPAEQLAAFRRAGSSDGSNNDEVLVVIDSEGCVGVTLAYAPSRLPVPRVSRVGRGQALQLMLGDSRLPCVEDGPTARVLAAMQPGDPIPSCLFDAVAEWLATARWSRMA